MASNKPRGSRVIYVAAAAREFPQDVQDWLGEVGNRAAASPHVYDALAVLAAGKKPVAMIVSMESIDWNELEFFDHAARLSRETRMYVTGDIHQQAKIDAACSRGAQLFDTGSINEDLCGPTLEISPEGPAGLLAGSLHVDRSGVTTTIPALTPRVVQAEPPNEVEAPAPPDRPAVRLVTSNESDETEIAVPFPWSPSPNRPQRTPPGTSNQEPNALDTGPHAGARKPPQPVMLTADELAALLGKSPADPGRAKEQQP